jgi:hypothetical protein
MSFARELFCFFGGGKHVRLGKGAALVLWDALGADECFAGVAEKRSIALARSTGACDNPRGQLRGPEAVDQALERKVDRQGLQLKWCSAFWANWSGQLGETVIINGMTTGKISRVREQVETNTTLEVSRGNRTRCHFVSKRHFPRYFLLPGESEYSCLSRLFKSQRFVCSCSRASGSHLSRRPL